MTLQQLLYVLTVSDEKTMNKAAEKLFVSQPTLTSAIQSLEKELDIQIFNRTSHGVTVTSTLFVCDQSICGYSEKVWDF